MKNRELPRSAVHGLWAIAAVTLLFVGTRLATPKVEISPAVALAPDEVQPRSRRIPKAVLSDALPTPSQPKQFAELFDRARSARSTLARHRALLDALEAMTPDDAPKARELVIQERKSGKWNPEEWKLICTRIGEVAGETVLTSILPKDPNASATVNAQQYLAGWASAEPDGARKWLENLPAGTYRDGLTIGLIDGLGQRDLTAAVAYMEELPSDVKLSALSMMAWFQFDVGGVNGGKQWLDNILPETAPKDQHDMLYFVRATEEVLSKTARTASAQTSEILNDPSKSAFLSDKAVSTAVNALAQSEDATLVLDFLSNVADLRWGASSSKTKAALQSLANSDVNLLSRWLNANGRSQLYGIGAGILADKIEATNPDLAKQWRAVAVGTP